MAYNSEIMWQETHRRWLRLAAAAWAAYVLIWIGLEGRLWAVILLAAGTVSLAAWRIWAGPGQRIASAGRRAAAAVGLGALGGGLCAPVAVLLMALKTGLHGHGPEFSPAEIAWVLGQTPRWLITGALVGGGLWLLAAGLARR